MSLCARIAACVGAPDRAICAAMASWRDQASQQAQADLDGLNNEAVELARRTLDDRGEFFPFAVVISSVGESRIVGADPGKDERPASKEVLSLLTDGLRAGRDDLRAVALVADVRLADSDAIRVTLAPRRAGIGGAPSIHEEASSSGLRVRQPFGDHLDGFSVGLTGNAGTQCLPRCNNRHSSASSGRVRRVTERL